MFIIRRDRSPTNDGNDWNQTKVPRSNQGFGKNWKKMQMSVTQVTCFFVFWAPYVIQQCWSVKRLYSFCNQKLLFSGIFDKSIPASIPRWVSDCMLLTAVFNSCINPIIYGWYYYKDKGGGTNTRLGVTKYK